MSLTLQRPLRVIPSAASLYPKVQDVIPAFEWELYSPLIDRINRLKVEKKAVILAHNYQTPEIFHGVADVVGDSLALAQKAVDVEAEIIVLCGVHFMAETAKLLNPKTKVLIPDPLAGCSLAESITAEDIRQLRRQYPGVPVVSYVNTSAAVKAETDVCCTSGNAVHVVESLGVDRVLFLPDMFLADYVAKNTKVQIIPWKGRCMVHEQFTPEDLRAYRQQFPGITIIAHPECPPDVIAEADMAGSTAQMIAYVDKHRPREVAMITECSMSDNVSVEFPDVRFVRPCTICPHMKKITLKKILHSLETETFAVEIDENIAVRARRSVEGMLEIGRAK
jgi:quinolinate synthase